MKKIVYLHGLESSQGGKKVEFLSTQGMVYAPAMDYKTLDLHEFIYTLGIPDLIIGSSMGGYVADIIGSHLGVDVLLFNPAFHSRTFELNFPLKHGNEKYNRTVVLGKNDDIISPEVTKLLLNPNDQVKEIEGMGHRTPLSVFTDICIRNILNYD